MSWAYDIPGIFWMEDSEPTSPCWNYVFDTRDIPHATYHLLVLLHNLKVIEYGTIYETVDSIRLNRK